MDYMNIPKKMLEIKEYKGVGYKPVVHFGAWRVAILNYIDELEPDQIIKIQKHNKTDESFILLKGRCILFFGVGKNNIDDILGIDMEPLKVYNVKKGTWHTHTLTKDAVVLIVENDNTSKLNSPLKKAEQRHRDIMVTLTKKLWKK
jgi:phage-related protein